MDVLSVVLFKTTISTSFILVLKTGNCLSHFKTVRLHLLGNYSHDCINFFAGECSLEGLEDESEGV